MVYFYCQALCFFFLIQIILGRRDDETVTVALDRNFNSLLADYDNLFLLVDNKADALEFESVLEEFSRCERLFQKSSKEEDPGKKVKFAMIDKTQNFRALFNVRIDRNPSILLYTEKSPNPIEYLLPFKAELMLEFIKIKTGQIQMFNTVENLNNYIQNKEILVYFGNPDYESTKFLAFESILHKEDDILGAICTSEDCLTHYNIQQGDSIFFKNQHSWSLPITGDYDTAEMNRILEGQVTQVFMKFDDWVRDFIFTNNRAAVFLFIDKDNIDHIIYQMRLKRVSRLYKGYLFYAITGIKENLEKELAIITRVSEKDLPCLFIYDARSTDIKNYKLQKELTEENIDDFIVHWGWGSLEEYYLSEEAPKEQTYPVITLVSKNFHDLVIGDPDYHTFVYFYSPTCKHCEKAGKNFEKLARFLLKKNWNIKFCKVNMDLNEIKGHEITYLPAFKLFISGEKSTPVTLDPSVEPKVTKLAEFLEKNARIDRSDILPILDIEEVAIKMDL